MSEFNEMLQYLSEDSSPPLDLPKKKDLLPVSNYKEMNESEASIQGKSHTVIEPSIEQNQNPQTKYNLLLPSPAHHKPQLERNTQSKNSQIVKTTKDIRETKLRIINLEDDMEEDVIEKSVEEQPQSLQIEEEVAPQSLFLPLVVEEPIIEPHQKIKFEPTKPVKPAQQKIEKAKEEELGNTKSNALFAHSKIRLKEPQKPKNLYDEESEVYNFGLKFESSNSLDTGMNVSSVMTSRDELSTRNILNYPQRKKKALPELKPYKLISDQKITTVASHQHLNEEPSPPPVVRKPLLVSSHQITNVGQFVKQPIEAGRRLQCSLIRNKTCSKRFYLDYDLETNEGKLLMSCKKMAFHLNSTYFLSLARGVYEEKSELFLGRVEGNFTGSVFDVYTYDVNSIQQREMVATISYSSNCSWCREQYREFELYVKNDNYKYYELSGTELVKGRNLKDLYTVDSNRTLRLIRKYVTKPPKWSEQQQAYVTSFRGKCKQGSVKNVVVVDEEEPNREVLLLAKQDSDKFAFDISHPFSPFIAFALMITGFDFKLASQ